MKFHKTHFRPSPTAALWEGKRYDSQSDCEIVTVAKMFALAIRNLRGRMLAKSSARTGSRSASRIEKSQRMPI